VTDVYNYLPLILVLAPAVCAFFIRLIPKADLASVRQIASFTLGLCLVLIARQGFLLDQYPEGAWNIFKESLLIPGFENTLFSLSSKNIVLVIPIFYVGILSFIFDAKQVERLGTSLISSFLMMVSFSAAVVMIQSVLTQILLAHFTLWFLFFGVAHLGGSQKGSAIMQTGIYFLVTDMIAFICIFSFPTYQDDMVAGFLLGMLILLPALSRLLLVSVTPFVRKFFSTAPWESTLLFALTIVPGGAALFLTFIPILQSAVAWDLCRFAVMLIATAALFFSALLAISERSAKQYCVWVISAFGALFVLSCMAQPSDALGLFWSQSLLAAACICVSVTLGFARTTLSEFESASSHGRLFWFASIALLVGIPGFGIGSALLGLLLHYLPSVLNEKSSTDVLMLFASSVIFFLLMTAAAANQLFRRGQVAPVSQSSRWQKPGVSLFLSWVSFGAGVFLCWLPLLWRLQIG